MSEEIDIIDWDGVVENDGESFDLLPDGDEVALVVTEVEKGHKKDGTTPQVRIRFSAASVNGHGRTCITDYIGMTRKMEWKLAELFRALGLRKHGDKTKLRWDLEGMTARATVTVDSYTGRDGEKKQVNKIKRYLDPAGTDASFE